MLPSEEFLIIGIQDERHIQGKVTINDLKALVCEHIQVDPYYPYLIESLNEIGVSFEDNKKVDIQTVFKALANPKFLKNIPNFMNKRITKYTIKLLRAGLVAYSQGFLTMKQIGDAASVHQMKEFENLTIGIPCNEETVMSILWIVGRTIPTVVLNKWIEIHTDYLEVKDTLMVHEFIYLMCNTKDRGEMYDKIPKLHMNSRMNKEIKLFQVDQEFHKTYKSPDYKMQQMLNAWYNLDKANYDGISKINLKPEKIVNKNKGKQAAKIDADNKADENNEFKKQLRSLLVTVEIKNRIRNANLKVSKMKLNGKMDYDDLTANAPPHLTANLPPAFGSKEYPMEAPSKENSATVKTRNLPRPQTALKINTEVSSPPEGLKNRPMSSKAPNSGTIRIVKAHQSQSRIPTAQSRLPTAQSRMQTTPSVVSNEGRKSISLNTNPKRLGLTFGTDRMNTPSSFQFKSDRRTLENTFYTNNSRYDTKYDTLTTFEDIFDQEYYAFEEGQKPKMPAKQSIFISNNLRTNKSRLFSA